MRLAERTVELNSCKGLPGAIGQDLFWFGLTQKHDAEAGGASGFRRVFQSRGCVAAVPGQGVESRTRERIAKVRGRPRSDACAARQLPSALAVVSAAARRSGDANLQESPSLGSHQANEPFLANAHVTMEGPP